MLYFYANFFLQAIIMQIILAVIAGLLAFTTFIYEDPDLLPTKLRARLFTYGQIVITWHLWACGSSWKYISLHTLGIFASLHLNTTESHPAAYGLLLHACVSLLCIIVTFNKDKHIRTMSQLFSSSPPPEVHVPDINWAPTCSIWLRSSTPTTHRMRTIGRQIF